MSKQLTQSERAERCILSLKQAVYQAAKAKRGVLGAIAEIYGLSYDSLALQVNPNRECHTLKPETIELVIEHTKDTRILDAVCSAHGNAGWFLLPDLSAQSDYMQNLGELGQRFGEMVNTAVTAHADGIIDDDEYAEIEKSYHALIGTAKALLESAKNNRERNKKC